MIIEYFQIFLNPILCRISKMWYYFSKNYTCTYPVLHSCLFIFSQRLLDTGKNVGSENELSEPLNCWLQHLAQVRSRGSPILTLPLPIPHCLVNKQSNPSNLHFNWNNCLLRPGFPAGMQRELNETFSIVIALLLFKPSSFKNHILDF